LVLTGGGDVFVSGQDLSGGGIAVYLIDTFTPLPGVTSIFSAGASITGASVSPPGGVSVDEIYEADCYPESPCHITYKGNFTHSSFVIPNSDVPTTFHVGFQIYASNIASYSSELELVSAYDLTTTPLPAALPLFASGLGVIGLLGWRRKRKNAAALAA
jgi:hypothetical protein